MHEIVIEMLVETGMTRNEALAYVTLLEDGSGGLTGYEVAARSTIPRSAVYSVLRRLEESGAAFAHGNEPARFVATDPGHLLEVMRRNTRVKMDKLEASLAILPKRVRPEPIFILSRYDQVMDRIDGMIRGAERSIYLSLWPRELARVRGALEAVGPRDLHRVLHSPNHLGFQPPGFTCWIDDLTSDEAKASWSHKALVIVDHREALIGGTEPDTDNHAVLTTNPSLVDVAINHIILDITLLARTTGVDPTASVAPMMRPHLPPSPPVGK